MSAISDFSEKQKEFNTRVDAALAGITTDVEGLNAKIDELQNTTGGITAEDQGILDQLQADGLALAEKLESFDALIPPPVPQE